MPIFWPNNNNNNMYIDPLVVPGPYLAPQGQVRTPRMSRSKLLGTGARLYNTKFDVQLEWQFP